MERHGVFPEVLLRLHADVGQDLGKPGDFGAHEFAEVGRAHPFGLRAQLLQALPNIELTLVIGQYAMAWHLPGAVTKNLTETVRAWRNHWPAVLPLPHPSPRNNIWLKANPWFELEVVPAVQARVRSLLMPIDTAKGGVKASEMR